MKTKPITSSITLLSALAVALCLTGCATSEGLPRLPPGDQFKTEITKKHPPKEDDCEKCSLPPSPEPPQPPEISRGAGATTFVRACPDIKVLFATDFFSVNAGDADRFVKELRSCGDLKTLRIKIEGHTDIRGTESYNRSLSSKRAYSIANIIEQQLNTKVSEDNIVASGEDKPEAVAPEGASAQDISEAHRKNRRAVITVARPESPIN